MSIDIDRMLNSSSLDTGTAKALRIVLHDIDERIESSVSDFGAVGDGTTDDTTALQAAITYAVTNGVPLFGAGDATYRVTSALTATGSLDFDLRGGTIDGSEIAAGTTFNERVVLSVSGSFAASVAVTADAAAGASTLTVASTSGLSAGDYVLVSSAQLMVDSYGNSGSLRGELVQVASASGTALTITSRLLFSYLTASSAKIERMTPVHGVLIRNGTILAGGVGSYHTGLKLSHCVNFEVNNIDVDGGEDVGVSTFYCYGGRITGGTITNSTNPTGGMTSDSGTGYGACLYEASRDIILDGTHFRNCKRGVTGGGKYPVLFCTTRNCVAEGGRNGVGNHEPCWGWLIEGNVVRGMTGVGVTVRGQFTKVHRNIVYDCDSHGIQVRTFYVNPTGVRGTELVDNYMERTNGIFLDGDATDGRVLDTTILGGEIRTAQFNNITVRRSDNVLISGVRMSGQTTPGSADGNGIIVSGTVAAGDRCTNVQITNIDIKDALRYGIRANYADRISINGVVSRQSQRDGVYLNNCTDSNIVGGYFKGGVVTFTYCITAINCLRTSVTGVVAEGQNDTGLTSNHGIGFIASSGTCTDNLAVGNTVRHCGSAVIVTGTGVDHSVVVGNNGRECYGGTKFSITSANQSAANNLS